MGIGLVYVKARDKLQNKIMKTIKDVLSVEYIYGFIIKFSF